MNQAMTDHVRMQCPLGHALEWRGRWVHISQEIDDLFVERYGGSCAGGRAYYPRSYYKERRV